MLQLSSLILKGTPELNTGKQDNTGGNFATDSCNAPAPGSIKSLAPGSAALMGPNTPAPPLPAGTRESVHWDDQKGFHWKRINWNTQIQRYGNPLEVAEENWARSLKRYQFSMLDEEGVVRWIQALPQNSNFKSEVSRACMDHAIDGATLLEMSFKELEQVFGKFGWAKKMQRALEGQLKNPSKRRATKWDVIVRYLNQIDRKSVWIPVQLVVLLVLTVVSPLLLLKIIRTHAKLKRRAIMAAIGGLVMLLPALPFPLRLVLIKFFLLLSMAWRWLKNVKFYHETVF
uniref:SAM domain-containing protein n=1 Tax=Lotharella oceanica TaxID=641309 RepID=A0A7S2U0Z9_9EUKA|mmetsp:Transcript_5264/g.10419  ORF Transcript_5264/g.10419 Transcript_5264/m.10419 type:complete len:287 (+) Transcript_5264:1119-1979(+)